MDQATVGQPSPRRFAHAYISGYGGCGFIASHLIPRLLQGGAARVIALDSMDYGRVENLPPTDPRLQIVQHRLGRESYPFLREILAGVDCVFHLAAEKHNQSIDNPQKVIDANISGTHALLQAAVDNKVGKFVFTSSLYAYGRMQGPPFSESEIPMPVTVYGISTRRGTPVLALQPSALEWVTDCSLQAVDKPASKAWSLLTARLPIPPFAGRPAE